MGRALIIANINCDHILRLNRPLTSGARIHYEEVGFRLGGGGANTGLGLIWAGHQVTLLSQVGEDSRGDWLIEQAEAQGLDCQWVHRHVGATQPLQLLMEPCGERTILRPNRPRLMLPPQVTTQDLDALYVNLSAEGLPQLMQRAVSEGVQVFSQLPKDLSRRPCHYLLTSSDDLHQSGVDDPWVFARQIGGESLKAFVVTRGAEGAIAYCAEGEIRCEAVPATLVDSTGAGDCYAAGLMHGILRHQPLAQAMAEAARWAAFAVAADSSVPPERLKAYLAPER
ncbi:PfkB family carbohydrate kinase [Ferrimonas pelagia]|uniref:PfkB family carbohydrate kinase n=1 Tax=Ferrimonas pelagia TaxID=1177826 RepID=A0ABP9EVP7_9GAMM